MYQENHHGDQQEEQLGLQVARDRSSNDESAHQAFSELFERYHKLLRAYVCSRINSVDAEDLHQDIWSKAWHRAAQFKGGNYRSWLFSIARNTMTDFYRRQSRKREEPDEFPEDNAAASATPLEQILDKELKSVFETCLGELDNKARQIVTLRMTGTSYKDICDAIDISENAAHKIVFNSKAQLRNCVEAKSQ